MGRTARTVAAGLLLTIAATACNKFGRADSEGGRTGTDRVAVGSQAVGDSTSTTGSVPSSVRTVSSHVSTQPGAGRPTPTTRDICTTGNTASRDDPSGFRLTVIVGTKSCYPRSEDFTIELRMKNTTSRSLYYDPNQEWFFQILPHNGTSGVAWSDEHCRSSGEATVGGAIEVPPGQDAVRAQALYPMPQSRRDREACRTLRGTYNVYGFLRWCPPESIRDGVCDPAKTATLQSAPVAIRVD